MEAAAGRNRFEGLDEVREGVDKIEAGLKSAASEAGQRYKGFVTDAGVNVTSRVARGAERIDGRLGDTPWRLGGLDARRTRIARGVLKDVVPGAIGARASAVLDGLGLKAGVGAAGILMRLPLKPIIAPVLVVLGAIETVKAVKAIKAGVSDVARKVDAEMEAEAAEEAAAKAV